MSDINQTKDEQDLTEEPAVEVDETAQLTAQKDEYLNNWKRSLADFENYKRRKELESKELLQYSKEMTVMQLIPSLQSLEQVLIHAPTDEKYKDWLTGLRATIIQLEKTMEELGVVKIKTVGEAFDPTRHEAVEEKVSESEGIIQEIQPGFTLNDKVIIPAKVVVGKKT